MSAKELKQQALDETEALKRFLRDNDGRPITEVYVDLLIKINSVQDLFLQSIQKQSRHLGILFKKIEELEK